MYSVHAQLGQLLQDKLLVFQNLRQVLIVLPLQFCEDIIRGRLTFEFPEVGYLNGERDNRQHIQEL